MSKATLPTPESNAGKAEWSEVYANDKALREAVNSVANEQLAGGIEGSKLAEGTIERKQLKAEAKPVTWYTPKIIATEESRTNAEFGTLTTADEIKEVVLPENGLMMIGYTCAMKDTLTPGQAGRVGMFLGADQIKAAAGSGGSVSVEANCLAAANTFNKVVSTFYGLAEGAAASSADVTTGQVLGMYGASSYGGGFMVVYAAPATYNVSAKFKCNEAGTVTVKERKLWVAVLG